MDIKYKITFHTYWHSGSGLAAGADADLLVIKDREGLPFVPGKTIKGLIREAVDLLYPNATDYEKVFGKEGESRSDAFFTNATLPEEEHSYIAQKEYSQFLYQNLSSTAITDEGIADPNTLRKIQVCVPCTLEGEILNVPDPTASKDSSTKNDDDKVHIYNALINSLHYIKRMGSWRNRGLGRCTIEENPKILYEEGGEA